ncbi:MAG: DNA-deoxyinosine glycosylase [Tannerella sp.]|jgi:hypoxanthine-DNA glycosylase|nr:DNA-deoxyinosine glycosylase [Tannerella sp.]
MTDKIIRFLDGYLEKTSKQSIGAPEANALLERYGILGDNESRKGKPLRELLRAGKIPHAYQVGGKGSEWVIPHSTSNSKPSIILSRKANEVRNVTTGTKSSNVKTSFPPIANEDTKVLILGTMPGDTSLKLGEYYGYSGNKFWQIIATITNNNIPTTYEAKKVLLLKSGIGIWDVANEAVREGSLDSNITSEEPNDIEDFIEQHKNLRIIGFNGKKAEELFGKYFDRKDNIKYISLPSSSSMNTSISFTDICKIWKKVIS